MKIVIIYVNRNYPVDNLTQNKPDNHFPFISYDNNLKTIKLIKLQKFNINPVQSVILRYLLCKNNPK